LDIEKYWNPVLETMPRENLEKLQLKKFKRTMQYAIDHSLFYQRKYEEAGVSPGDIKTLEDVRRVPLVDKSDFKLAQKDKDPPPFGELLGVPLEEVMSFSHTSGTTGTPVYLPDTAESFEDWKESWCYCLYGMGFRNTDIVFMPFPYNVYLGFWLGHLSAQKLGCTVIPGGGLDTKGRIRTMKEEEVTATMCTPTYGFHMAKVAHEMGLDLAKDLKVSKMLVMGEPVSPETKQELERQWGADVYEHIGTGESCAWAASCTEKRGMHVLEHLFLLEVLDRETVSKPVAPGEEGIGVITTFGRRSFPCVRFNLWDIMTIKFSPASIEEIIGTKFPEIAEYEIVATRSGTREDLLVKAEPSPSVSESSHSDIKSRLIEEIKFKTNLSFDVEFVSTNSLPRYEIKSRRFKDLRGK
jgi:phenylacetate-CoA ligase